MGKRPVYLEPDDWQMIIYCLDSCTGLIVNQCVDSADGYRGRALAGRISRSVIDRLRKQIAKAAAVGMNG